VVDPTFAEWLRHRALAAGYDLDARGVQAKLAKDTGISPTQIGRTLNSQTMPDIQSQLRLARVLKVEFSEMLIRSGFAEASDFPTAPAKPRTPSVYEAAEAWGIDPTDAPILQVLVESFQKRARARAAPDDPPR
jgi:transcriptional regulator with XRE-family HTH domain